MYNLLIALGSGAAAALLSRFILSGWWAATLPGLLVFAGVYFVLARRTFKQAQAAMESANGAIMAQNLDRAMSILQAALALERWQFMVAPNVHGNIGMLLYLQKKDDEAAPHLRKALGMHWVAKGMLAALLWRQKKTGEAIQAFEDAVKSTSREPVLWNAYAWCLWKNNDLDAAIKVLVRAIQAVPSDERTKNNLDALRNGGKMKMKNFAELWYQFRLENPPVQIAQRPGQMPSGPVPAFKFKTSKRNYR
ncbi:MAG: hypothetical protein GMKNLPBB_00523 [Myxococcota bacterium]|nr:hypothetical protein [Myxococcota bacterium]